MSPVPGNGLRTPMLACGPAAERFARLIGALGASVDVLPGPPGTAAARKLVRSVFYKGLAAAVTESLRAGRAAGCEEWLRDNIRQELAGASAATLDRLEQGSVRHAPRRIDEMTAAAELLTDLGVPPRITAASAQWLRQLAEEQAARAGVTGTAALRSAQNPGAHPRGDPFPPSGPGLAVSIHQRRACRLVRRGQAGHCRGLGATSAQTATSNPSAVPRAVATCARTSAMSCADGRISDRCANRMGTTPSRSCRAGDRPGWRAGPRPPRSAPAGAGPVPG